MVYPDYVACFRYVILVGTLEVKILLHSKLGE